MKKIAVRTFALISLTAACSSEHIAAPAAMGGGSFRPNETAPSWPQLQRAVGFTITADALPQIDSIEVVARKGHHAA